MRAVLTIAGKDLTLRLRDRSVFIIGIVAPLALALIFDLVFGGALAGEVAFEPRYAIVDLDRSEISAGFADIIEELEAQGILESETLDDVATAEERLDSDDLDAVWVLPSGFGASVGQGGPGTIEVIGNVDSPTSAQIARSIAERFALGIEQVGLNAITAAQLGAGDPAVLVPEAVAAPPPVVLGEIGVAVRRLDPATYTMAGMAVFFLFFTVQFGVTSLLEEKREGTLARLLAAPIPRWATVAAKGLVSFVLGVGSMAVLMVAATWLLGAEWGPILPVALLVAAGVLSAVGVIGLVAGFAKSDESAGNIQSIVAVVLGMLGGTFFQVGQDGGLLSRLQWLTPHAWFLRGLGDLAGGGGVAVVTPAVGAMLAFAIVTGGIGWLFLRRRVEA